jgi:hypothetical protein
MRIYRFEAKMAGLMNVSTIGGRMAPPSATSATDAALGLRPRRALSSAQLSAEWTTSNPLRNDSSLNSFSPLISCLTTWVQCRWRPLPLHPYPSTIRKKCQGCARSKMSGMCQSIHHY